MYHFNIPITQPIINYSTYSREDGSGKQMIYLNQSHIGKELSILGCIWDNNGNDIYEELRFLVH